MGKLTRAVLGVPEIEDGVAVGLRMVVRIGETLQRAAALAIGDLRAPTAGRGPSRR